MNEKIYASELDRRKLVGKGLVSTESGNYIAVVRDLLPEQLLMDKGFFIANFALGYYNVVPAREEEANQNG